MLVSAILLSYKEQTKPDTWAQPLINSGYQVILVTPDVEEHHLLQKELQVVYNDQKFTPHAINKGIKVATGDYILLCGARSFPSETYAKIAIPIMEKNPNIGCVGGRIIHTANTRIGKAIAAAMGAPLGMGIFSFRSLKKNGYVDSVSTPIFRRDTIEKVGLFDENLIRNQDDDYSYRIKKAGYKIWHETTITSTYFVRETYLQLTGQFFQYGFWKNYVNKKHFTITTIRQVFPSLLIFITALLSIWSLPYLIVFLSIYLSALLVQSCLINKFQFVNTILSFVGFLVMHLSYGIGYILGFVYAFILNKPAPSFVKTLTR